MTVGFEQTGEEEMRTYEVSDEGWKVRRRTASDKAGNYTLFFCTALDLCPSP